MIIEYKYKYDSKPRIYTKEGKFKDELSFKTYFKNKYVKFKMSLISYQIKKYI